MSGTCGRTKRIGQMMCGAAAQQDLALDQRLADQPELVIFEIAQAAMDQLAAARRGALGEIVLLAQQHLEAAAGGVAGDAGAVDAAADDDEIEWSTGAPRSGLLLLFLAAFAAVLVGRPPWAAARSS